MTSLSASFQKGKTSLRVSFAHNERTPESVKKLKNKQSHIDAERTKYNVILIGGVDVNDEYEKIFVQAVRDYNARQKRNDRKIDERKGGYYRKVLNDATLTPFREFVVQLGSADEQTDRKTYNAIYEKFLHKFQKENKNLDVISAVIHHDEQGAPHMHIVCIPIAKGYKRGMSVRPSFNKAMGFKTQQDFADWTEKQRDTLAEIAKGYGIDRKQVDGKHDHLEPEQYRELIDQAKAKASEVELTASAQAQKTLTDAQGKLTQMNTKARRTLDRLGEKTEKKQAELNTVSSQVKNLTQQRQDLMNQLSEYQVRLAQAKKAEQARKDKVFEEIRKMQLQREQLYQDLHDRYTYTSKLWGEYQPKIKQMREENWKQWHNTTKMSEWNDATEKLRNARSWAYQGAEMGGFLGLTVAFIASIRAKKAEEQVQALREERARVIRENTAQIKQMHDSYHQEAEQNKQLKEQSAELKRSIQSKYAELNKNINTRMKTLNSAYAKFNGLKGSINQMSEDRLKRLQDNLDSFSDNFGAGLENLNQQADDLNR